MFHGVATHTSLQKATQVLASLNGPQRHSFVCNFSKESFVRDDTSLKSCVEAGCNIFTHLAFMSHNMSVCHLAVMFTCGATRTNQEVYPDTFGLEKTNTTACFLSSLK